MTNERVMILDPRGQPFARVTSVNGIWGFWINGTRTEDADWSFDDAVWSASAIAIVS